MNGNCDTKVKQILDAIEYGKLLPADTEKRLLEMIEQEINKEDTAADMGLISIAQDLLFELHNLSCERTEESERRLDQLRKRISATVAKREAYGNVKRRVIKFGAAVAVFVLLVVGIFSPLQLTWFESWSTPDEQQRVVQLHTVTLDLVSQAIADNGTVSRHIVDTADDVKQYLGFDCGIHRQLGKHWDFNEGYIQYYLDSIEVVIRYTHNEHPEKRLTSNITFYTDSELAWFMFEQSQDGELVSANGYDVYISKNIDKASAVWYQGMTILHLSGDATEEEIIMLALELIGE